MVRPAERSAKVRTGAVILAAALLLSGEVRAQSSSSPLDFLGNIFSRNAQTAPSAQPGAPAPAQATPRPRPPPGPPPPTKSHRQRAAAVERRGRRLRPSPDDGERDPRGGREFSQLRGPHGAWGRPHARRG